MEREAFLQDQERQKEERQRLARSLFQKAYKAQMRGDLEEAVRLYKESLEAYPTAEAHTFLGWTYSFQGRLEEAIQECHRAIEIDPDYGNPYNDIGAYLIEQGRLDEAVPWLEKATQAPRYECRYFPWMNLGRVWERKGRWDRALECYRKAVQLNPDYLPAAKALARLRALLN